MITVVKFGGHAMSDNDGHFGKEIASAQDSGRSLAIVHGGGPQINKALDEAGIASHFLGGFRVTTLEIFEVVDRVLNSEVGPSVAKSLEKSLVKAEAISGRNILRARMQTRLVDGTEADLGFVGEVMGVEIAPLTTIMSQGVVPVISPVATSTDGVGLNVNADIAAAAISGALGADELIIMTDVAGIYRNWPDPDSLIDRISSAELSAMKGEFAEGMAPKVQACLDAIEAGATAVRIIDGRSPEAFASALAHSGGTLVYA